MFKGFSTYFLVIRRYLYFCCKYDRVTAPKINIACSYTKVNFALKAVRHLVPKIGKWHTSNLRRTRTAQWTALLLRLLLFFHPFFTSLYSSLFFSSE